MFLARWVDAPRGKLTVYEVEPTLFDEDQGRFVNRAPKTWAFSYGVSALARTYQAAVEAALEAGGAR